MQDMLITFTLRELVDYQIIEAESVKMSQAFPIKLKIIIAISIPVWS